MSTSSLGGAMSGITQDDIARFDAAFYGVDPSASAELTIDRLREWLAAMDAPEVADGVLRVRDCWRSGKERQGEES